MTMWLVWAVLGFGTNAWAGEQTHWQGRLLDSTGTPIEGDALLELTLYDDPVNGTPQGTFSTLATAADGYISVPLSETFSADAASLEDRWVDIRWGGTGLGPRQPLRSAATAIRASRIVVEAAAGPCTPAEQGQIRWDTTLQTLRVCVEGAWNTVNAGAGSGSGPGSAQANPVSSCADVTEQGSGRFWIDYGTGAVQTGCDPSGNWTVVLDYTDDNSIDDIPDGGGSIATGFTNANAYFIGNAALNALPFEQAEWCTSDGSTTHCFPITDADWSFTGGDVDSLIGSKRRVIAALSGQVDAGATVDGANGDFYASRVAAAPPICPSPGYAGLTSEHGHIRQWSYQSNDADWHTWGNGLALYKNGANAISPTNELTWGDESLSTPCGPEWEHFFIRVRQEVPGSLGSNRLSAATDCADVLAADAAASDGFYWIDPDGGSNNNAGKAWCDFTDDWTHVLHYLDDNAVNDIPDSRWVIASGFTSANATYIGNDALNQLTFSSAEWCMSDGTSHACFTIGDNDWTYSGNDVDSLNGNVRKVIAALSGQVDYGRTVDGASGDFYATRLGVAPPICPGPGYAGLTSAHGHIRQWSGSGADWHTWGNGLALHKNGSATYGIHNELLWDAQNLSPNTRCGPEWNTFYIRVR